MERRLPLGEFSYPVGLSFLLHGLLAMVVVYAPPWFRGRPFKVPVSYEVTLVAPSGGGVQSRASVAPPAGPKVATAPAKAGASPSSSAQPREYLTLPFGSRPVVPQAAVRPLPPPTRSEEMTLPAKRSVPDQRPLENVIPPPSMRPAAPQRLSAPAAPPVAPILPPAITAPPSLAVVKPTPHRPAPPVTPPTSPAPPSVVAPQVTPPPAIAQPVITPPVVTPPRVTSRTSPVARADAEKSKAAVAPSSSTRSHSEAQSSSAAGEGFAVGSEPGVYVGNTDPALAYYIVLIQDKFEGNWAPPKMGQSTVASVILSLRILRSGQVRDLAVDLSSDDRHLDDSALRAVRLSTPLPPLPPLYKTETLFLKVRFNFEGVKS